MGSLYRELDETEQKKYLKGRASGVQINSIQKDNFQEILSNCCGVLGFVRFLKGFYLIVITQRKKVAKIGMHSIYTIKDMKMV
jgi:hypothetical protein